MDFYIYVTSETIKGLEKELVRLWIALTKSVKECKVKKSWSIYSSDMKKSIAISLQTLST